MIALVMVFVCCSNASCEQISLQPIQSKDVVLETTMYKLGYGGYTVSMAEIYDDLKEVMGVWKMKDTKKIRYQLYLNLYAAGWADNPDERSYFLIRFFHIK